MRIDLEKVDAQIRKLEELRRIASDPELMSLLETVVVKNGAPPIQQPEDRRPTVQVPPVSSPERRPPRGAVIGAIKAAALRSEKPFSGYDLAGRMQAEGFKFVSSKPGLAVIDALKSLRKQGVVRVFRSGKGSNPTLYERILPISQ